MNEKLENMAIERVAEILTGETFYYQDVECCVISDAEECYMEGYKDALKEKVKTDNLNVLLKTKIKIFCSTLIIIVVMLVGVLFTKNICHEEGVKEYLQHPERYTIKVVYEDNIPIDTIVKRVN